MCCPPIGPRMPVHLLRRHGAPGLICSGGVVALVALCGVWTFFVQTSCGDRQVDICCPAAGPRMSVQPLHRHATQGLFVCVGCWLSLLSLGFGHLVSRPTAVADRWAYVAQLSDRAHRGVAPSLICLGGVVVFADQV